MLKIKALCVVALSLSCISTLAQEIGSINYLEPQFVSPENDQPFLKSLGFPSTRDSDFVNYLFVAQDKREPKDSVELKTFRRNGGKKDAHALASHSDVIMVLSLNKKTKSWLIFSLYRGNWVPDYCHMRKTSLEEEDEQYLANYYFNDGRKLFIPCIEKMVRERIQIHSFLRVHYGYSSNNFRIHGFFEGTKENTIEPLAKDLLRVVSSNKLKMVRAYGLGPLVRASVVVLSENVSFTNVLSSIARGSVNWDEIIDIKHLYVEAKERNIYKAGGYQRAFNMARLIVDLFAWAAYGFERDPGLWRLFENAFNKNFSRSFNLADLIKSATVDGENLIHQATYKYGIPQVDIVQFGASPKQLALFKGLKLNLSNNDGKYLPLLRGDITILPTPPSSKEDKTDLFPTH